MIMEPITPVSTFEILYEDDRFVVINKPCGIMVHRSKISEDTRFVLQLLRDQINLRIYPVHRLDRATSGVLVFGKDREAAGFLATQFREQTVHKKYVAIIRGHVSDQDTIDYPLAKSPQHEAQSAITHYTKISDTEIDAAISRYPTSRYSFVEIKPETGRRQQIRRHFSHLRHPIIGDKKNGDCKHNNYFQKHFDLHRLFLHAQEIQFKHPGLEKPLLIKADWNEEFERGKTLLRL